MALAARISKPLRALWAGTFTRIAQYLEARGKTFLTGYSTTPGSNGSPYSAVVHILGFNSAGKPFQATGLVIGPHTNLTAAHVLAAANNLSILPTTTSGF